MTQRQIDIIERALELHGMGDELIEAWQTLKSIVLAQQTNNNRSDEICPHYYKDRIDLTGNGTNFEVMSCCRTMGKLLRRRRINVL